MARTQTHLAAPPVPFDTDELDELLAKYGRFIAYPVAAELTTLSVRSLKRETAAGNLPCYRIGSARALRVKTLDALRLIQRVA